MTTFRPCGVVSLFVALLIGAAFPLSASAQTRTGNAAGESVYKQRCARCHEQTDPRIPPRTALNRMPAVRILKTLDFGAMMTVAYPMSRGEREAVAAYLGTNAPAVSFPARAYCSSRQAAVSDNQSPPGTAGAPAPAMPGTRTPKPPA